MPIDNNISEREMKRVVLNRNYVQFRIMRSAGVGSGKTALETSLRLFPAAHNSEGGKELHELIGRPVARAFGANGLESLKCPFLHREVRFDIHVGS